MPLIIKIVAAGAIAAALIVGLLLAISNSQVVDVDLVLVSFSTSLGAVLVGAFSAGCLVGLVLVLVAMMSKRVQLALKERELKSARKEVDNLRAIGIKGSHG